MKWLWQILRRRPRTALLDCGRASKLTRGTNFGPITEVAIPPLTHRT